MSDWLEFFNTYRVTAQHVIAILLGAAIWRWGGGPERWLIATFIITMVAPIYVVWGLGLSLDEFGLFAPFLFVIDIVATALFVAIALQANRNYPLWLAGFQLVAVVTHIVRSMVDDAVQLAFAMLIIGPSYAQLLVLLGGTVRHWLRERRFGPYREWREEPPGLRWIRP